MEIKLSDNSRIHFVCSKSGAMHMHLLKPVNLRDGHGLIVTATAILERKELSALLTELQENANAK